MHKLLSTIVASLVTSAMLAAAAQADRPDDRAGLLGIGRASTPTADTGVTRPDDRPGPRGVATAADPGSTGRTAAVRPDDRAGGRWPLTSSEPPLPRIAVPGEGFRWTDATIGAGVTVSVLLLAMGLGLVVRRRRRLVHPLPPRSPLATHGRSI